MFKALLRRRPAPGTIMGGLALFISLGGIGYAATGGNFILGQANTATTKSTLSANIADKALQIQNGSGSLGATALGLSVAVGKPPFTVNSPTKVTNLNSDRLDGLDSTSFVRKTQEPWREVGTAGQPPFQFQPSSPPSTGWQNYLNGFNTVAFFKDSLGIVHLKGLVRWANSSFGLAPSCDSVTIFQLPAGYRPAAYGVFPAFKDSQPTRLDVGNDGWIYLCTLENTFAGDWYSLDGITFRAAG